MGRISRLRLVTVGRIEAFLASLERPEDIVPQLVKEMQAKVKEAIGAETKALTAVKAERRRLDAAMGRVARLQKGAELALKAGDEETARQAVAAQLEAEGQVDRCKKVLETAEAAYNSAAAGRQQLQKTFEELKVRSGDILSRARAIRLKERIGEQLNRSITGRTGSILDMVMRMEAKLDEAEAKLDIQSQVSQTLGATFEHERVLELESDAEVDRRLEELKKCLAKNL
jgi:phage shock protein A